MPAPRALLLGLPYTYPSIRLGIQTRDRPFGRLRLANRRRRGIHAVLSVPGTAAARFPPPTPPGSDSRPGGSASSGDVPTGAQVSALFSTFISSVGATGLVRK